MFNNKEIKNEIAKNGFVKLEILKNPKPAENYGSIFGQDVEPIGTYVIQKEHEHILPGYWEGIVTIKNPLLIDITDIGIDYKYELSNKYKAKGKRLTNKILKDGYDSIITYELYKGKEYTQEIVVFNRDSIEWISKNETILSFNDFCELV